MHGNPAANFAVQNSDLIIALGTRFDDRTTGSIKEYAPKAFEAYKNGRGGIIHVNINNEEIDNVINTHYNFNMTCKLFTSSILEYILKKDRVTWNNQIQNWKRMYSFKYKQLPKKLKTQEVISNINKYLLEKDIKNYIITTGVGNHQMMACQFIKWRYPKSFITSGSLGTMGVGIPFAIGSQLADRNKLIIDIDGDGSFNHTLAELKTIQNYNLPIKIAIMNDSTLSMVGAWEHLFFNEQYTATDLKQNPDYVKLAESFWYKRNKMFGKKNLYKTIDEFLSYDGAILCDFTVQSDLCLPLIAPGSSLDNMIFDIDSSNNFESIEPPS